MPDHPGLAAVVTRLRGRSLPLFAPRPWVSWDEALRAEIAGDALGLESGDGGTAVRAGLHLWNDDLAESHALSQRLQNPSGSYWHGLMHRREGDLDNSAHWFRRVGDHPLFSRVWTLALSVGESMAAGGDSWCEARVADLRRAGAWDPFTFLDWCRTHGEHPWLAQVQVAEIDALLAQHMLRPDRGL